MIFLLQKKNSTPDVFSSNFDNVEQKRRRYIDIVCTPKLYPYAKALPVRQSSTCTPKLCLYAKALPVRQSSTCTPKLYLYAKALPVRQSSICTPKLYLYAKALPVRRSSICTPKLYLYAKALPVRQSSICTPKLYLYAIENNGPAFLLFNDCTPKIMKKLMTNQASILVCTWLIRALMDLEVVLLRPEVAPGLKGTLLHSGQKSGWAMDPLFPLQFLSH